MERLKDLVAVLLMGIVIIAAIALGNLLTDAIKGSPLNLGVSANSNVLDTIIHTSTSTSSYCTGCPVKLLSRNYDRQYARIQNLSDTAVYLYMSTTTLNYNFTGAYESQNSATGTITTLDGLIVLSPINSNVGGGENVYPSPSYYDILPDNLIIGEIWATSTADGVSKNISILYK